jgi:hypothetical protein
LNRVLRRERKAIIIYDDISSLRPHHLELNHSTSKMTMNVVALKFDTAFHNLRLTAPFANPGTYLPYYPVILAKSRVPKRVPQVQLNRTVEADS